jgi:CHAT domain-containing protein
VVEYFYIDKSKVFADSSAVDYYALILKPSDELPTLKYLFNQDDLIGQLDYKNESNRIEIAYRGEPQIITQKKQTTATQKAVEGKLYQLCWKEIQASLSATDTTIFYSPAGLLHKVSFCAINTPLKEPLSKRLKLNYLSSSQILLSQSKPMKINENTSIALFANPPTKNLDSLPYSSKEILKIKTILDTRKSKIEIFDKEKATELNFKTVGLQLKSPSIVHIATHGKYNIDTKSLAPMLRSVLMFDNADKNNLKDLTLEEKNEGLLTAFEASGLNFNNTQLVVLSACESGLGDDGGDEGVFGLQRAFKMAGAEYILASLWSVPDEQTSEMMSLFYNNLVKGNSIPKSFEMAQSTMRPKYSPYYWGAFVLMK